MTAPSSPSLVPALLTVWPHVANLVIVAAQKEIMSQDKFHDCSMVSFFVRIRSSPGPALRFKFEGCCGRSVVGSVVGETSPSRLATPRHLPIARWRPKNSGKGWRDLAIHPNNPGEIQTFKRSRLTILRRELLSAEIQQFHFIEMAFQLTKA